MDVEARPDGAIELTRDELVDLVDRESKLRREVTAAELIRSYYAGTLEEPGEVADIIALAELLAPDDPIRNSHA